MWSDWDDPQPDDILMKWERWRNELPLLEKVKVPHCVKPPEFQDPVKVEINSFADASEKGIGEVSYLRMVDVKDEVHVSFLIAKSRVAPIIFIFLNFIYLTSPTRAGSPQQLMPITVGPHYLTHPVNFPCGRKPEYPEKTHDLPQSVDLCSFHMRTCALFT